MIVGRTWEDTFTPARKIRMSKKAGWERASGRRRVGGKDTEIRIPECGTTRERGKARDGWAKTQREVG